jgi:hypothetical protein
VGNALNIGTVAGSALVGAGVGSAESELSGGNPLLGALGGASSGAIGASGISGDVSNFVGGGFLGNALGSAAQGALRMGANIGVGMIGKGING